MFLRELIELARVAGFFKREVFASGQFIDPYSPKMFHQLRLLRRRMRTTNPPKNR
jgi:hypothetical protein